jgi:hypothetical protein
MEDTMKTVGTFLIVLGLSTHTQSALKWLLNFLYTTMSSYRIAPLHGSVIVLLVAGLTFLTLPASVDAAQPVFVDICHYELMTVTYQKVTVPDVAEQSHLDHGDVYPGDPGVGLDENCQQKLNWVFALVWIDTDRDHQFTPKVDRLIAKVEDSDAGDEVCGNGDTLCVEGFPSTFNEQSADVVPVATTGHTLTSCEYIQATGLLYMQTVEGEFYIQKNAELQLYQENETGIPFGTILIDYLTEGDDDLIQILELSPSEPEDSTDDETNSPEDDYWLDVAIDPDGSL